jgi:hypothetical protein
MRQLVYALRFTGRATPASPDGAVLKVTMTAPSCTVTSIIRSAGLTGTLEPAAGGEATFASEVTFTGATSFQEVGTIAFGDAQLLRFSTVGSGYLGASPDPARRHGAVALRVEWGEGQFAGASGLITSNFVVGNGGDVADHHFGIIVLR